jgi:hypothetical protein
VHQCAQPFQAQQILFLGNSCLDHHKSASY